MKENENVQHPRHYNKGKIECIAAIKDSMCSVEFEGYLKGNIIKYLWRYRDKNGLEDLEKARVHLDWLIEEIESQESQETDPRVRQMMKDIRKDIEHAQSET